MSKCKRCEVKTVLSESDIMRMVDEVTAMKGIRLADEELYGARFGICSQCEYFMYGSTCAQCGCVMQVRARLSDGRCPKKKWQ
jgi:hypothetical protein